MVSRSSLELLIILNSLNIFPDIKLDTNQPNKFMSVKGDPRYHNTSSLVGKAVHDTEQKTRIYKSNNEMPSEAKRAHEREEQLLVNQRARLRKKSSENNPGGPRASHGPLPSELEAVRQHLRHVQLDNHRESGIGDRVMDLTNNNVPDSTTKKHHGMVNGFGKRGEENMKYSAVDKDVSDPYAFIQDDSNAFQVYAEINDNPNYAGKRSIAESSSVSSSSYYADIDEVVQEMTDLANQAAFDEKLWTPSGNQCQQENLGEEICQDIPAHGTFSTTKIEDLYKQVLLLQILVSRAGWDNIFERVFFFLRWECRRLADVLRSCRTSYPWQ